jgi:hypothetical protein
MIFLLLREDSEYSEVVKITRALLGVYQTVESVELLPNIVMLEVNDFPDVDKEADYEE